MDDRIGLTEPFGIRSGTVQYFHSPPMVMATSVDYGNYPILESLIESKLIRCGDRANSRISIIFVISQISPSRSSTNH